MSNKADQNIKETYVSPGTRLLEAIAIIDSNDLQIAFIVDENECLLGSATDGDIRRGLLTGLSLDEPVEKVMNTSPITVSEDTPKAEILELIDERQIRQVPVLDKTGKIIKIETRRSLTEKTLAQPMEFDHEDVWVVLMLGGAGKRLHPLTEQTPKPMIPVGDKPLLETIIAEFTAQGFKKFFFSLNYKADVIKDYFGDGSNFGAEISYIMEDEPRGTAGSLSLLPDTPTGPCIVMNGDIMTTVNFAHLLDFHTQNRASATMCVREYTQEVPYGIVQNNGVELSGIIEKPQHTYFVNAGIYVLNPNVLQHVPKNDFFDMPQLFEEISKTGEMSAVFPIREYWLDIGRIEDLERAREEYGQVFGG